VDTQANRLADNSFFTQHRWRAVDNNSSIAFRFDDRKKTAIFRYYFSAISVTIEIKLCSKFIGVLTVIVSLMVWCPVGTAVIDGLLP